MGGGRRAAPTVLRGIDTYFVESLDTDDLRALRDALDRLLTAALDSRQNSSPTACEPGPYQPGIAMRPARVGLRTTETICRKFPHGEFQLPRRVGRAVHGTLSRDICHRGRSVRIFCIRRFQDSGRDRGNAAPGRRCRIHSRDGRRSSIERFDGMGQFGSVHDR